MPSEELFSMFGCRTASILAIGVLIAGGLTGCDKIKSALGMGGTATDFRNAQIDVADTPCSDDAKLSTVVLQDGRYQLGSYQFSLLGDVKHGDVFGRTQEGTPPASVFIGKCVASGQTSQVLFVYGVDENGKPKRLAAESLSDDGNETTRSFDVRDGTIVVAQSQDGKPAEVTYALLNGKMTNLTAGTVADAATADAGGSDTVSLVVFREKLQPYGQWIEHPRWGEVWHPSQAGFRPYENGHWEDSDEYGTVWVSNDAWGDQTTHYGRWAYDPGYGGWLWVPGYVWGPSWVVWRASDQYVGWFPMPPGAYDGDGEFVDDWGGWYGYRGYPGFDEAAFYGLWTFVAPDDVYAVDFRTRIIDRRGYGRFIGRSRAWTHYGIAHGHVFSRGLDRARFREAFHHDAPGSHHDFKGGHVTSVKQGRAIAAHERNAGHQRTALGQGGHGGQHGDPNGPSRSGNGFAHAGGSSHGFSHSGGGGSNGLARSGGGSSNGFSHSRGGGSNGFARSGGGGGSNGFSRPSNGFARSGGGGSNGFSHSPSGISRSGGGGSNGFARSGNGGSSGFARSGGGGSNGVARSGGGGGFGGLGGGGNTFGGMNHNGGGGMGGMMQQHQPGLGRSPAPQRPPSGGNNNNHHH
jgi:hypothetical protein